MPPRGSHAVPRTIRLSIAVLVALPLFPRVLFAQSSPGPPATLTLKPLYVPAAELLRMLGAAEYEGAYALTWDEGGQAHRVQARPNATANQILLFGSDADLETARRFAASVDEIDPRTNSAYVRSDSRTGQGPSLNTSTQQQKQRTFSADVSVKVGDVLRVVDERGIGRIRNAPRILTLNGRLATLLDGERVTYVSRASGAANIIETQTMDAGLKLEVRPSLGDTGYLLLEIKAELTSLISQINDTPVKSGQILENSVVVKDGDTVLLGGFQRVVDRKSTRRVPVLGWILPFLFSREKVDQQTSDEYIVLSAHVVDFSVSLDDSKLEQMKIK